MDLLRARFDMVAVMFLLASASGCAKRLGDACVQSTDCSTQGTRACDTSQPGGYCTIFGCAANSCPDNGACVDFRVSVPGCSYNDYQSPSRTARQMCMAQCGSSSDCRSGYSCVDPTSVPWFGAAIIDDNRHQSICVVLPSYTAQAVDAAVCVGSVPFTDGSVSEASFDGGPEDAAASVDGDAALAVPDGSGPADVADGD